MGRQTRKWSYKHDKLTQCCRAFTLAFLLNQMTFLHSFEMLPHYLFLDSANESNTDLVSGY